MFNFFKKFKNYIAKLRAKEARRKMAEFQHAKNRHQLLRRMYLLYRIPTLPFKNNHGNYELNLRLIIRLYQKFKTLKQTKPTDTDPDSDKKKKD